MSKRRTLKGLIDHEFADGREGFRELVDFVTSAGLLDAMPARERALVRMVELIHVAMIEGANECVEEYGLDDLDALTVVWDATGISLACLNGQSMSTMFGQVRREMLKALTETYNRTAKSLIPSKQDDTP